ncbi:MAG: tRNA pseudouridine(38-40) synthase TruA [Oscillospiraceae bacterium]|jgi:tRNA pseudouridine38-40 synthase|nr:tRNA pseudouridine(38-40) synthase TruA [Oscillospiraceae bacterium]
MKNLLLTLCYDGSAYHGWQVQKNASTVQECLQDAIERVFGARLPVVGCSRTDTGVHAHMFCCNFKTESPLPCERVIAALNAYLPFDIAVTACRAVPGDFHARYSCTAKEYRYLIWNSPVRNPFFEGRALHYNRVLDDVFLNEQSQLFLGKYDFSAFCAAGGSVQSKVRSVKSACVVREEDFVSFFVTADGFLYNMVRIMVGTLLGIHEGKIERGSIRDIILSKDRARAGATAPAQGLYLEHVCYEHDRGQ